MFYPYEGYRSVTPLDAARVNRTVFHKHSLYIVIRGSPSGCVRRKIPGVTQVHEKGHEGNTAVVTAYVCWRKHGIYIFHEE